MKITQAKKHNSCPILDKKTPFYGPDNENIDQQHYGSQPSFSPHLLQNQESNTTVKRTRKESLLKRILIVDDDSDITLTFKVGLEGCYDNDNERKFEVYTFNDPLLALTQFKPHFYDLLLTDIYMPHMNGFQLSDKILELDANVRVCFISAAELNIEALREVYPKISIGCFIKKPVSIDYLLKRLLAELD
jgi:CheY-like chemotaxis protein